MQHRKRQPKGGQDRSDPGKHESEGHRSRRSEIPRNFAISASLMRTRMPPMTDPVSRIPACCRTEEKSPDVRRGWPRSRSLVPFIGARHTGDGRLEAR